MLDDLLAPTGFNVDIDVGRTRARIRQEALEEQVVTHRVHRRDPQAKAHGRVRRAATPLAQNASRSAKVDDLLDDQEVAGEAEALDDAQLPIDRLPCAGMFLARAVALAGTLTRQVIQPRLGRVAAWDASTREPGGHEAQVEGAIARHLARVGQGARVRGVQARHLGRGAQEGPVRTQVSQGLVHRGAQSGRRQDVAERAFGGRGHARPGRGDQPGPNAPREVSERIPHLWDVPASGLPLDEESVLPARRLGQRARHSPRPRGPARVQCTHEGAAPPAGQDEQVSPGPAHVLEGNARGALPHLRERPIAHHADEILIAARAGGQDRHPDPHVLRARREPPPGG